MGIIMTDWEAQFTEDILANPERVNSPRVQGVIDQLWHKYMG